MVWFELCFTWVDVVSKSRDELLELLQGRIDFMTRIPENEIENENENFFG